ncbi:MAG: YhjD/YihY/BrkB family envelope integrity protein, partial [Conexibacter sp.]
MRILRLFYRASIDALSRFAADDGWAIASHIALSTLMALFPFIIVLTALAGFFGSKNLADEVTNLMLQTWPAEVSGPIAQDVHRVLTTARGDVLTVGAVFAVYFASSGVESVRIGLDRAYGMTEVRNWLVR